MSEQNLEKFSFVHTINSDCIVELAGARRAILPVFRMGVTKLQDDRAFKMDEQDFTLLKQNLAGKKTPTPILYEHGHSPRGGIAGGKLISLQAKGDEIFAHATLTKKAYDECKDEEWLSCSGGFLASRDEEGNIRPVEMLEVSFTNLPAFPGLSDIQTFSVLTPKESEMTELTAEKAIAEVTADPPEAAVVEAPVVAEEVKLDVVEPTPEPVVVTEPIVEPEKLETTPDFVSREEFEALKETLKSLLQPAPVPEPVAELAAVAPVEEQVVELTAEQNEAVMEMVVTARVDEKLKKEQVVNLMAQGEAEGKIIPANKEAMQVFAEANPDAFKVALGTMKAILPVKKTINDAVIKVDLGLLDTSPEHEASILSKAVQLKAQHPELSLAELSVLVKKNTN